MPRPTPETALTWLSAQRVASWVRPEHGKPGRLAWMAEGDDGYRYADAETLLEAVEKAIGG